MKKSLSTFILLSTLGLLPFANPVSAEEEDRKWYITAGAGVGRFFDVDSHKDDYTINSVTLSSEVELDLENSVGYDIGVGYELGDSWRAELNYSRQYTEVDWTTFNATYSGVTAAVGFDTRGDATSDSIMASINKDFKSADGWTPYVGVGIGFARIHVQDISFDATELGDALEASLGTTTILEGDTNLVPAFQLKGGIGKEITDRATVFAEASYNGTRGFTGGSGDTKIEWKGVENVLYRAGVRYKL